MISWGKKADPLESNNLVPISLPEVNAIRWHFDKYIPHVVIPMNVLSDNNFLNLNNEAMPLINIPHGTEGLFFIKEDINKILKKDVAFMKMTTRISLGGNRTIKNRKSKKTRRSRQ